MDLFTYPKAGLAAGANAVAEATTAAKQNAVFMVKSSQPNPHESYVLQRHIHRNQQQYNTNARKQPFCTSRTNDVQKQPVLNTYLPDCMELSVSTILVYIEWSFIDRMSDLTNKILVRGWCATSN